MLANLRSSRSNKPATSFLILPQTDWMRPSEGWVRSSFGGALKDNFKVAGVLDDVVRRASADQRIAGDVLMAD